MHQGEVLTLDVNEDFIVTGSKASSSSSGKMMVLERETMKTISVITDHVGSIRRVIITMQDDGTTLLISWGEMDEYTSIYEKVI